MQSALGYLIDVQRCSGFLPTRPSKHLLNCLFGGRGSTCVCEKGVGAPPPSLTCGSQRRTSDLIIWRRSLSGAEAKAGSHQ